MSIVKVNFFSESLMRTVNFIAVVPIDKRSVDGNQIRPKGKAFKTLYLLHGIYGSEYDWITGTRIIGWAQDRNLVVIMPAGENSFYNDQPKAAEYYARYIGEELVDFTRRMFPLSEEREDTYIAGLSMGGYGAFCTGLRYPETFGYMGCFSSALILKNYPKDDHDPGLIQNLGYFESVLGKEEEVHGSDRDYFALARKLVEEKKRIPKLYMACGLQDQLLLKENREYRDYLRELGLEFDYFEDEGGHDWDFWNKHIYRFLEWLPLEEKSLSISSGHVL